MTDLTKESKNWRQQADKLLKQSNLLPLLQTEGEVIITGSYAYDLMLGGDIDLYLITPKDPKTVAQKLLTKLVKEGFWNGYMLYDWVNWRQEYFPSGFYLGTQTDFVKNRWKVDIWVLNEFPAEQKTYKDWLEKSLNNTNRKTILELKEARKKNRWPVDGKTIYDAVIKDKISTPEEFAKKFI